MKHKSIIIAVLGILSLFACSAPKSKPAETAVSTVKKEADTVQLTPTQLKNADIALGHAEQREMHSILKVTGIIDVPPQNIVSISMPMGGYLKKMALMPGLKVSKGAVLATMEDPQYIQLQQDYLTAKSRLVFCEAEYNRQLKLNETRAASDKVLQQAKSDFDGQRILASSLAEKLLLIGIQPQQLNERNISRSVNICAPISGYVTKVNVNTGKYVSPTDVLFELVNPGDLHLTLTVFENDAASLSEGQKIVCYTNSHPDVKYDAEVHLINPSIGKDRTTEVHCHFLKLNKELLPGMYMNANVELNNVKQNCVPQEAIVQWSGASYVFVEAGSGKYVMRKVATGTTDEGFIAIKSGIDNETIVTKNAYTLLTKLKNSGEE